MVSSFPAGQPFTFRICFHFTNPTDTAYPTKSVSHGQQMATSILVTPTPFFETTAFATSSIGNAPVDATRLVTDSTPETTVASSGRFLLSEGERRLVEYSETSFERARF